jgi:protein kinase C substrate 80K-H
MLPTKALVLGMLCCATLATRPKGVRLELASFYNPATDFKCLDGSNIIPFIQVNDDYCDCEDGSDEPGTSACPNGKFYCENKGHRALVIHSSRVGDRVCDCCDGADEWESKVTCPNTCQEMGRAAREAFEAETRVALEGFKIRQSMANEAKLILDEKMVKVQDQEKKKQELETLKEEKQKLKDDAEAPEKAALDYYKRIEEEEKKRREEEEAATAAAEAAEYFSILDTDMDGVVTMAELQTRPGLDTNKDGEVSEDEAKFFLGDKESFDIESFKDAGFALLKPYLELEKAVPEVAEDDGVELAPPVEEYHAPDHPMMTPPPTEFDPDAPDHPMMTPAPDAYEIEDYPEENEEDEEEDYDINDHEEEEDDAPKPEEVKEEEPKYDEKTQELINNAEAARKAYTDIDREFRDVEREIKQLQEALEKDHGEDNVFAVLSGQCFSLTDNEYTYKMCPFDHCSQRGKHGGSETRLGSWGSWTGPDGDKYASMKFTGGQGCWNGPARSTTVYLECGAENTVTSVTEPNRCEYEMHFSTPAACKLPPGFGHDEL